MPLLGQIHVLMTENTGLWTLVWAVVVGGCHLNRLTEEHLLRAGTWETVEIDGDEQPWSLFPRIWGRLVKVKDAHATSGL